jgi:uncharacterized protein YkwD
MNHRRSRGGYHNRLTACILVLAGVAACARLRPAPVVPTPAPATGPLAAERAAVVVRLNRARADAGLPELATDAVLERVGNAHCELLIEEGTEGHFSRSGVPPYLRYFLAGGHGFHRENAARYSSSAAIPGRALDTIVTRSLTSMLSELPPDDGHRRTILDPDATNIGIGLAVRGGELRETHELAVEVATEWSAPAAVARPRGAVALAGALARPWRPAMAQILWEPLPRPLSTAEANAIRAYGYPPPRVTFAANRPSEPCAGAARADAVASPFAVDRFGHFSLKWSTGTGEGVEIAVVLARRGDDGRLIPVAAAATVVTEAGTLPPELAFWHTLAGPPPPARGGAR